MAGFPLLRAWHLHEQRMVPVSLTDDDSGGWSLLADNDLFWGREEDWRFLEGVTVHALGRPAAVTYYAGDIVEWGEDGEHLGVVMRGQKNLGCNRGEYPYIVNGFYVQSYSEVYTSENLTDDLNNGSLAVRGNIYEHPHLLAGKTPPFDDDLC